MYIFTCFEEEAAFIYWFADCVFAGAKNIDCPDDYMWDMKTQCKKGGEWVNMFRDGLRPEIAISVKFSGLKLNS